MGDKLWATVISSPLQVFSHSWGLGYALSVWILGGWRLSSWGQPSMLNACVDWLPINPRYLGARELPWMAIPPTCCNISLLGELNAIQATPLARTTGSWCLVSPGLYSVSFAFVDFSLYLFTIIIHNYKSFESFWVLLENHWTWGWAKDPQLKYIQIHSYVCKCWQGKSKGYTYVFI